MSGGKNNTVEEPLHSRRALRWGCPKEVPLEEAAITEKKSVLELPGNDESNVENPVQNVVPQLTPGTVEETFLVKDMVSGDNGINNTQDDGLKANGDNFCMEVDVEENRGGRNGLYHGNEEWSKFN